MKFDFPRTFGQDDVKDRLARGLASGRFPHALLVHGEPGLGQHALLLDIARILSCEGTEHKPCGTCFPCRGFDASALETLHYLIPVTRHDKPKTGEGEGEDEGPEAGQIDELAEGIAAWHAAPYAYGMPEKAMVRMSQVRELLGRLRYAEAEGRVRVVLVPWLEALHEETSNALLKTLEEPPRHVYFLIASEHHAGLRQTLLSRCVQLGLSPLPADAFQAAAVTLARQAGFEPSPLLLPFAERAPGVYVALLAQGGERLLEDAQRFLVAAAADWRVFVDHVSDWPSGGEGMGHATRLLHFLLRMLRAHQVLRAQAPAAASGDDGTPGDRMRGVADGYRWTAAALARAGWDEALVAPLGAFEDVADVHAFAAFLEEAHRAVRDYSKPSMALTGLFLEYEAKAARVAPRAEVSA